MSDQSTMSRVSRTAALSDHIDEATERLLSRQMELIRLSSNKDKDTTTIAVESAEIEACASSIVRSVEDLLVVTRNLKEAWVLGQIRPQTEPLSEDESTKRLAAAKKIVERLSSSE